MGDLEKESAEFDLDPTSEFSIAFMSSSVDCDAAARYTCLVHRLQSEWAR